MMYVALASLGVAAVTAITLGNLLRITVRQHARERDALIDKVCHLAGKPWHEAPAEASVPEEFERSSLVTIPEQLPDDWQ